MSNQPECIDHVELARQWQREYVSLNRLPTRSRSEPPAPFRQHFGTRVHHHRQPRYQFADVGGKASRPRRNLDEAFRPLPPDQSPNSPNLPIVQQRPEWFTESLVDVRT